LESSTRRRFNSSEQRRTIRGRRREMGHRASGRRRGWSRALGDPISLSPCRVRERARVVDLVPHLWSGGTFSLGGTRKRRGNYTLSATKWPRELIRVDWTWGLFGWGKRVEPVGKVCNQTIPKRGWEGELGGKFLSPLKRGKLAAPLPCPYIK
jgi:hypothetical protein